MLLDSMVEKEDIDMDEPVTPYSLPRQSTLKKRVSAMMRGITAIQASSTMASLSPSQRGTVRDTLSHTGSNTTAASKQSSLSSTLAAQPMQNPNNLAIRRLKLKLNDHSSTSVPPPNPKQSSVRGPRSSNTVQEDAASKFQEHILERDWLPMSEMMKELKPEMGDTAEAVESHEAGTTLPEDEEIDHKAAVRGTTLARQNTNFSTPTASNHATPVHMSTFSQLKCFPITESQIPVNTAEHGQMAPTAISPSVSTPTAQPEAVTMAKRTSLQQGVSAPVSRGSTLSQGTAFSFAAREATPETKIDEECYTDDEKAQSPKKRRVTDTFPHFRNSFRNLIMKTNSQSTPRASLHSPRRRYHDNTQIIYERAKYLYTKYVETNSNLSINLSGTTRSSLINLFQLDDTEAFDFMYNQGYDSLSEADKESIANDTNYRIRYLKTYLYHCFDVAFHDIWGLVRDDAFLRFQFTPEYEQLVKTPDKRKSATPTQTELVPVVQSAPKATPSTNQIDFAMKYPSDDEEEEEDEDLHGLVIVNPDKMHSDDDTAIPEHVKQTRFHLHISFTEHEEEKEQQS